MPKHITTECSIPITCDEIFHTNLTNMLFLLNLMNYTVAENPCLPKVTLRLRSNMSTYTTYEIMDLNDDWVMSIHLYLSQHQRHKKKLRTGELYLTDTHNVLYKVELSIPIQDDPFDTEEAFSVTDTSLFDRIRQLIDV